MAVLVSLCLSYHSTISSHIIKYYQLKSEVHVQLFIWQVAKLIYIYMVLKVFFPSCVCTYSFYKGFSIVSSNYIGNKSFIKKRCLAKYKKPFPLILFHDFLCFCELLCVELLCNSIKTEGHIGQFFTKIEDRHIQLL